MTLQTVVNEFGSNVIVKFTGDGRIEHLTNIPLSGFGVGTMTFVLQNYGAGNYKKFLNSVENILILDLIVSVVCSLILAFAGTVGQLLADIPLAIIYLSKRKMLKNKSL